MKRITLSCLINFWLVVHAGAGVISSYSANTSTTDPDLLLVDQFNGSGYTTHTISTSNLVLSIKPADNFDMPATAIEHGGWQGIHAAAYGEANSLGDMWANLSQWNNAHLVVSNGAVYSDGTGANPSGAQQAFSIPVTTEFRVVTTLTIPATNNSVVVAFVGVNPDPVGTPVASGATTWGVGIVQNAFTAPVCQPVLWNKGSPVLNSSILSAGTYTIEICGDTNTISAAFIFPNHTNEFISTITRASMGAISNVIVWIGDPRGFAGVSFGATGARASYETVSGRIGEGNQDTVINTVVQGDATRAWLPPSYDSRKPSPLLLYCHGVGGHVNFTWTGQSLGGTNGFPERGYYQTLVSNGVIVVDSELQGDNWGNAAGVNAVSNVLFWCRQHFNISGVFLQGASMGGLASLNFIDQHKSEVNGWIGLYPVASLSWMYNNGWTANINTAYNIPGGGTYAQQTAGSDPMLQNPRRFYRVPMIAFESPSDTTVLATSNSVLLSSRLTGFSANNIVSVKSGLHGDPSHYDAPATLNFIKACLPSINTNSPSSSGKTPIQGAFFPNPAAGDGSGLYNVPTTGIANFASIVETNNQPTTTHAYYAISNPGLVFQNGPGISDFAGGGLMTFFSDSVGYAFNNQNNTVQEMTLSTSGLNPLVGIIGTTAVGNASAGNLGEFVSSLVASTAASGVLTTAASNITSVSLTAGDWDVYGNVSLVGTSATVTGMAAGINTTTGTIPTDGSEAYAGFQTTTLTFTNTVTLPLKRVNVSSTTSVFLVGRATFSAGTVKVFGNINARRVR